MIHDWETLMEYAAGTTIASCVFSALGLACALAFFIVLTVTYVKHLKGADCFGLLVATMILFGVTVMLFIIDASLSISAYKAALRHFVPIS